MKSNALVAALLAVAATALTARTQDRSELASRVEVLTRDTRWTLERAIPITFPTFHPQGMVKIGDTFFVSSVEVRDRAAGDGVGHLFKINASGGLEGSMRLGEGAFYHPGGLDYDGTHIWTAAAEYRPNSRAIVYRIDPRTLTAREMLRVDDHIGAVVFDADDRVLVGLNWGSRKFYRWRLTNDDILDARSATTIVNRSHYVDYQDCKYAGGHRMACSGVTELRQRPGDAPFRLGGIDLVDVRSGEPLHQAPVLLWTAQGLDMTHNPVWLESAANGLRAYFMPEDDRSTIYVYTAQ